jgi:UrcA family protein
MKTQGSLFVLQEDLVTMFIVGKNRKTACYPARRPESGITDRAWPYVEAAGIGLIVVLGLMLMLVLHGPAHGQGDDGAPVAIRVPYSAADLRDVAHARLLLARLDRTALAACGDDTAILDGLRAAIDRSDCRRQGVLRAVARIHAPALDQVLRQDGLPS